MVFLMLGEHMRLNFIFLMNDLLILVLSPFAFRWGKMRQIFKVKR